MTKQTNRYWLTFSIRLSKQPVIWTMSQKFAVVFNIRNANITDQLGLIALELPGEQKVLGEAVKWLRQKGVKVDPIELGIIES